MLINQQRMITSNNETIQFEKEYEQYQNIQMQMDYLQNWMLQLINQKQQECLTNEDKKSSNEMKKLYCSIQNFRNQYEDINNINQEHSEFSFQICKNHKESQLKVYKQIDYGKLFAKMNQFDNQLKLNLLLQINYADYLSIVVQTLAKASSTHYVSQDVINFIHNFAKTGSYESTNIALIPKIIKLGKQFINLKHFKSISQQQLLEKQEFDQDTLQNSIWTRQQIIQCLVCYSLIECEIFINQHQFERNLIINNNIEKEVLIPEKICTHDYSWNENCYGNIRDFHPKLAKVLNERYQIIRNMDIFDRDTRIAIINYTQSLLGYYHHHYSYSKMQLDEKIKEKIKNLLYQKYYYCEMELIILVANARMFVQILYALK